MNKGLIAFILIAVLWWFNPFALNSLSGDLPHNLKYKEKVFGSSSSDKLPMVIVLHGAGGDEEDLEFLFEKVDANFRYIGFRGPISFGPGYTWSSGKGANNEEAQKNFGDNLNDAAYSINKGIDELKKKYPTKGQPIVFGFSSGAQLAMFLAGTYPKNFYEVFAIAGAFNTPGLDEFFVHKSTPAVIAYGGQSDSLTNANEVKAAVELLSSFGRDAEFVSFNGGHTVPDSALSDLVESISSLR